MDVNKYEELLKENNAIINGHFLLTSGLHSDTYVEKFELLKYPDLTDQVCSGIAEYFQDESPTVVVGAATGGIPISQSVARELEVRSIFSERVDGEMIFKRGFEIKDGEKVLIVDDIVTTGGSIKELINLVNQEGGEIAGVGVIVDRSEEDIDFGVEYHALVNLEIPTYTPEECPLCQKGKELTTRGRTGKKKSS